jgi:DNA-directed RNA polymerase specialized sigma24 family protein
MGAKKRRSANPAEQQHKELMALESHLERIAKLLALLVIKDQPQNSQIPFLSGAGFSPSEIAEMLGTTANTVSVTLSRIRSSSGEKKSSER